MDLPIPAFGDVVGLRRLYRAAVGRIHQGRGQRGLPGGPQAGVDRGTDPAARELKWLAEDARYAEESAVALELHFG